MWLSAFSNLLLGETYVAANTADREKYEQNSIAAFCCLLQCLVITEVDFRLKDYQISFLHTIISAKNCSKIRSICSRYFPIFSWVLLSRRSKEQLCFFCTVI